jgi:hypothetical protein
MFAVLTKPENVYVGELCNPVLTFNITNYNEQTNEFELEENIYDFNSDPKNILNNFEFAKIKLFGIGDCMEFVTPDVYHKDSIDKLIEYADKL